jgi:hypothetical protein
MAAGAIAQLVGGSAGGTAIAFFGMWMTGLIHTKAEIDEKNETIKEYKHALELERARSDSLQATGAIVREVMTGLREELRKP